MVLETQTLKAALEIALFIAETLAKVTTTRWDDEAVKLIKAAINSPELLELLRKILSNKEVIEKTGKDRDVAIFNATKDLDRKFPAEIASKYNFTIEALIKYLPLIVRLLLTVLGKRA
jgi:chorismate mutase